MKLQLLTIAIVCAACTLNVSAQVTIGSDSEPAKGALLDIKQQAGTTGTATATGGLLLPRVELKSVTSLDPPITGATNNAEHKGLTVYNLTTTAPFREGIYVWNGAEWVIASASYFIYMPPFNLPLGTTIGANLSYDLFYEYQRQFTSHATNNPRFKSSNASLTQIPGIYYDDSKFDYVVPWYDNTVITVNNITDAGILNYTVLKTMPSDSSFITIVLVPKY